MEYTNITLKIDPGQVADLKRFVRDEIRGDRAAVSTPLDGWCEITTLGESGTKRTFIKGPAGDQQVRTAQIDLERLRAGVRDLLRDVDVLIGSAHGLDRITIRLQDMLK